MPSPVARCSRHLGHPLPEAKSQRERRQPFGPPSGRESVEEGVRGGVVGLSGAAQRGRGGREENELRELELAGQLVQVDRCVELGPHDPPQAFLVQRGHDAVVQGPGRVHDRGEGPLARDRRDQALERTPVRDVAGGNLGLAAELAQVRHQLGSAGRLHAAAADQQQVPGAVALGEPPGQEGAEPAGAARDQDGAVRARRLRHAEHELAGVARLAENAEGLRGAAHVPGGDRQMVEDTALEQPDDLGEDLADPLGPGVSKRSKAW